MKGKTYKKSGLFNKPVRKALINSLLGSTENINKKVIKMLVDGVVVMKESCSSGHR